MMKVNDRLPPQVSNAATSSAGAASIDTALPTAMVAPDHVETAGLRISRGCPADAAGVRSRSCVEMMLRLWQVSFVAISSVLNA
jgi:hypothetical protein